MGVAILSIGDPPGVRRHHHFVVSPTKRTAHSGARWAVVDVL